MGAFLNDKPFRTCNINCEGIATHCLALSKHWLLESIYLCISHVSYSCINSPKANLDSYYQIIRSRRDEIAGIWSWVQLCSTFQKKNIFTKCNHSCTAPVLRAERGLISISISNAPVKFLYLFRTTIRMLQVSILLLLPLGTSGLALKKQSGWPHPHVPYRFPSRTNERLSESFSSLHLELGEWSKIYRIYSLARNRRRIARTEDRGSAHENVIMQIGI